MTTELAADLIHRQVAVIVTNSVAAAAKAVPIAQSPRS
jgi:hypothetical protein